MRSVRSISATRVSSVRSNGRSSTAGSTASRWHTTCRVGSSYDRPMSLEWEQTIVDSRDPSSLGRWWADALGWVVVNDDLEEFEIRPSADRVPGLLFVSVPEPKSIKNRLHLDFRPDDRDAEVDRLLSLGASRAEIGQGERSWVVLVDPEGNDFCVLGSRTAAKRAANESFGRPV